MSKILESQLLLLFRNSNNKVVTTSALKKHRWVEQDFRTLFKNRVARVSLGVHKQLKVEVLVDDCPVQIFDDCNALDGIQIAGFGRLDNPPLRVDIAKRTKPQRKRAITALEQTIINLSRDRVVITSTLLEQGWSKLTLANFLLERPAKALDRVTVEALIEGKGVYTIKDDCNALAGFINRVPLQWQHMYIPSRLVTPLPPRKRYGSPGNRW
jgi:hypothetical protein